MRTLAGFLIAVTVASAGWATIASLRMAAWLSQHGVKVNWLLIRLFIPWYVHRYQEMTMERQGRPGPLFAQFLVSINLALACAVAAALITFVAGKG